MILKGQYVQVISPYTVTEETLLQRRPDLVGESVDVLKEQINYIHHVRYMQAMDYVAMLSKNGVIAISPIVSCHPMSIEHDLPGDFEYWQHYCKRIMDGVDDVHVLMLPGWEDSKGVRAEIIHAIDIGKPVWYIEPIKHGEEYNIWMRDPRNLYPFIDY